MADYLTNYEHSLPNNIICGPIQPISIIYYKLNIYNGENNHPLQKFWFLLKDVKITEYNNNYIKIALSNSPSDKKFIEYINNLDDNIHKMICDLFKINFCKQISYISDKYSPILFILNNFSECILFDQNCQKIMKFTNEHINHTLSILVELSDIIIGDDKYWINYTPKQLKINKSICDQKSIFEIITEEHNTVSKHIINPQLVSNIIPINIIPPIPSTTPNQKQKNINIDHNDIKNYEITTDIPITAPVHKEIPVKKFVISVNDLKNQINKMRNKKLQKEEEKMNILVDNMKKEITQFKNNQQIISDKYKLMVESINNS